MNKNSKMIAVALSLGVSLGTLAQTPIIYAKENINLYESNQAKNALVNQYTVSTDEELKQVLDTIKNSDELEATIVLAADVNVPTENYESTFGVGGKHITIQSSEGNLFKLNFSNRGLLAGSCTFDNVNVVGDKLYCNGYKTVFTKNGQIHLSQTLYGGGYKTSVKSTYVVLACSGEINPTSLNGIHNVIGGSYQANVEGNTYLEISGNIQFKGGNHITPGCVMGDGTSGDSSRSPDVYVGGTATLVYDNQNNETSPAIDGTYGCEMKGDVLLDVRSGRANEICGNYEYPDKSIIDGNLHIIAGSESYENTDRTLRLSSNWPITGAGHLMARSPFYTGIYKVGGNVTIDTYENVWGWDKGTNPTSTSGDPEIYGAIEADVGGSITINAHGSHMADITGAEDSNVVGNVEINATNVELKNKNYGTDDDEGDIYGLYKYNKPSTTNGIVTINVNGGDVGLILATDQDDVSEGSQIHVTGKPKIRTGILGTAARTYKDKVLPTINIDDCEATIPFIQAGKVISIENSSNITVHEMELDTGLNIKENSTLTTDDNQIHIWGNTQIDGTWEQFHSQEDDYNDIYVMGTTSVGENGKLINHGTSNLKGDVTNNGTIAFMMPAYAQSNFISNNGTLWLPVVNGNNYDGENDIDLYVAGTSSGSSNVLTVDASDYTKAVDPHEGDNYILSNGNEDKKEKEEVIYKLVNESKKDGYYLKSTDDVATLDPATNMWQVAKIPSYKVTYEFKSNKEGQELPQDVLDLLPSDDTEYEDGTEIAVKQPTKTEVKASNGIWKFDGYDKDSKTSSEGVKFVGTWKFSPNASKINHIPTITATDKTLTVGDTFNVMKDVTAHDDEDGDLTDKIEVIKNKVDTSKAGSYEVTYKVTDKDGASRTKTITVTVVKKKYKVSYEFKSNKEGQELPQDVLDLLPSDDTEYEDGTEIDAKQPSKTEVKVSNGIWKFDGYDKDSKTSTEGVKFVGTWKFSPNASKINHIPTITAEDKTLTVGDTFNVKKDVTAHDDEDGDLTDKIEVIKNEVDTSKAGSYEVTYKVTDKDGASRTKTITVTVVKKKYKVSYEFKSNKEDQELPQDVLDLLPSDDTEYEDGTEIAAKQPSKTEVKVSNGIWKFDGYDKDSKTSTDGVKFVGTWKFSPNASKINHIPTITAEDKTLTVGDTFNVKKDVTAHDDEDGDLTDKIEVIKNEVDTSKAGSYEVTYKVTDKDGASRTKTITVTVNSKMEPINWIPTINANDKTLTVGDTFNPMDGVTANDHEDGDLTSSIVIESSNVDTNTVGSYQITYRVSDSQGATARETITVTVNPKMEEINWIPTISATDKTLTVGDTFNPMDGVTANDHEDGDLSSSIVIESSNVDTNTAGSYQITYRVSDSQGATARKTITVTVNPKMEPINWIPTINAEDRTLDEGEEFDPMDGVTANDHEDGDLTSSIVIESSNVDVNTPGIYEITYKVSDSQGATATKTISVTVLAKEYDVEYEYESKTKGKDLPDEILDLLPEDDDEYAEGRMIKARPPKKTRVETDDGVWNFVGYDKDEKEADDENLDKNGDIEFIGYWEFTAKKTNEAPVITADDVTIHLGDKFNPKDYATAKDKEDGDITSNIKVIENAVNTNKVGKYKVTYEVIDSGNNKVTKTITVTVIDNPAIPSSPKKIDYSGGQSNTISNAKTVSTNGIKTGLSNHLYQSLTALGLSLGAIAVLLKKKKH